MPTTSKQDYEQVLNFWFNELEPRQWFMGGPELDKTIHQRYLPLLEQAHRGELDDWANTPTGRLALIIVLDQFSRQIYRHSADAYAQDRTAQKLTVEGIKTGMDKQLKPDEKHFFYMPLMHAEDRELQALSVIKFTELKDDLGNVVDYAKGHAAIVEQFGRFPHRNTLLGRTSSVEEETYLNSDENKFR